MPLALLVPLLPHDPTRPSVALLGIALVGIVGVVAQIWLLVLGFRTATGCHGGRLALTITGSIFAAELVTKLALVLALVVVPR